MEMSDRNDGDDIHEIRNVDSITSYTYSNSSSLRKKIFTQFLHIIQRLSFRS